MQKIQIANSFYYLLDEQEYTSLSGDRMLSRSEVAELWGISPNRLSECPYLLPRYKRRERNAMYREADVKALIKIGKKELKKQYVPSN